MPFFHELLACLGKLWSENLNDHLIDLKKENFDIIESDEDFYISISYLRKKEYEKVDIQDFLYEVYQKTDDDCFSMKNIKKKGIKSRLCSLT